MEEVESNYDRKIFTAGADVYTGRKCSLQNMVIILKFL